MIAFWQVLVLLLLFSAAVIGSFGLGALVVYKTKREPHEALFGKEPKGEVFSIDNIGPDLPEGDLKARSETVNRVLGRNDQFMQQFSEELPERE